MDDIKAITPTRFITVAHRFDNRPLSKKKNIAAPIIATEISQKDPPTISCGNNSLFISPHFFLYNNNLIK
jgi:hypothetical protein